MRVVSERIPMGETSGHIHLIVSLLREAEPFVWCTVAGVLGALANIALDERPVALPRMEDGRLHLGFLGNLIIAIAMAHVVDHDFRTSFFAAVCGTTTLRAFKQRIESTFEIHRKELIRQDDGSQPNLHDDTH